jgi:hypothetical protein
MTELTREAVIDLARRYYPSGFPVEKDDYSQPLLAHQRTPEHERWRTAWKEALDWKQWEALLERLESAFPAESIRDATQPWHSACRRCCLYVQRPHSDGGQTVIRVAAAVSILAPLYLTYVTIRNRKSGERASPPQLTFEAPREVKPQADMLARLVEQELGCRPFPLEYAGLRIPDIRVGYRNSMEPPSLMDALFSDDLANLP